MEKEVIEFEQEITAGATVGQIPVISDFVESVMSVAGFNSRKTMEVLLAVEEACTNIANYAYPGKAGTIHIVAKAFYDRMILIIEDHGIPFDPTTHTVAVSQADAKDRPIGGLGIHLMRSFMDGITFQFKDGKNVLTMVKNRAK